MPSTPRQIVFFDPTPGNEFGIVSNRFSVPFPLATLPGSAIVVFATINNGSGNTINGFSDTVNGGYTSLDHPNDAGNADYLTGYFKNAAALSAGDFGTASSGTISTLTDNNKNWTVNQWAGLTVLNETNGTSAVVISNTSATLTFAAMGTANAAGNIYTVGDHVDVSVSGFDSYNAGVLVEVSGVTTNPLLGHNAQIQTVGASGTDNLSSLTAACGSAAGMILGFCSNANAGSSPFVPLASSTFTDDGSSWAFDLSQVTLRLEHKNVSNPGTTGATFSSQGADVFAVAFVALLDASGAAPNPPYPWQSQGGMGVHIAS